MFDRTKQCKLSNTIMLRLNNFLYVFNLRQGTILIAVHQIALSSFVLIIFLVAISHAADMMTMLHNDMEDDAERRGFDELAYGDSFHEGDVISTNNQRRFARAQHLATVTVLFLYTGTVLTLLYLVCCASLLHGAIHYKREFVLPWLAAAAVAVVLLVAGIYLGAGYPCIVDLFGGHALYHFGCALFLMTFVYAICAVISFALETGSGRCARAVRGVAASGATATGDERGERLLLLDHAAHSSLLSAAQLSKLSHGTRTQFV